MRPASERFWAFVIPEPMSGCWIWLGARSDGWGMFRPISAQRGGAMVQAHRWAYEHFVGSVPSDLEIDHVCRNRSCVNPAHLEAVTHVVNVRRGAAGAHMSARTHCPAGHQYSEANTYQHPQNGRQCRVCNNRKQRAARAKKS